VIRNLCWAKQVQKFETWNRMAWKYLIFQLVIRCRF
jgi:hypothetical protein